MVYDGIGLHSGYLTGRQLRIWNLLRSGLSQSEIARGLNISRQAVNQLAQTIPEKVTGALNDAASLNGIEPRSIDSSKGMLLGWSREFRTEAVITMNLEEGLRVWYRHNLGRCKICPDKRQCRSMLLRTAEDQRVFLTSEEKKLLPSKLSSLLFSKLRESAGNQGTRQR